MKPFSIFILITFITFVLFNFYKIFSSPTEVINTDHHIETIPTYNVKEIKQQLYQKIEKANNFTFILASLIQPLSNQNSELKKLLFAINPKLLNEFNDKYNPSIELNQLDEILKLAKKNFKVKSKFEEISNSTSILKYSKKNELINILRKVILAFLYSNLFFYLLIVCLLIQFCFICHQDVDLNRMKYQILFFLKKITKRN